MLPTSFGSHTPIPGSSGCAGYRPLQSGSSSINRNAEPAEYNSTTKTTTTTTSVEISGGSRALANDKATGVEAYQAVDKVADANNPYAQTIISFIELQLQRDVADGATQEELQSRLEAGLKGFEEGYNEAYDQLKDSGLLDDGVKAAIEETFDQVHAGVSKLADKFGLEQVSSPETGVVDASVAAPVVSSSSPRILSSITSSTVEERYTQSHRDMQTIKNLQKMGQRSNTYEHLNSSKTKAVEKEYSYTVAESRDFSFQLRTKDGDVVTVRIQNAQIGTSNLQVPESGKGEDSELALGGDQWSDYTLDIDGVLDDAELDAISELLAQVGDISESFYSGDLDQALDIASNISFYDEELDSFSLSLNMTSVEQSTETTRHASPSVGDFSSMLDLPSFEPFAQMIRDAGDMAEGLGQSRMMVPDLMDWVGRTQHTSDPHTPMFGAIGRAVV